MYKMAIIGDRESVIGFMALGFSVYEAADAETAGKHLTHLLESEEYGIVFITEEYAKANEALLEKGKEKPLPAVTVIPDRKGSTGYGMGRIRSAAERAIGADILFKE